VADLDVVRLLLGDSDPAAYVWTHDNILDMLVLYPQPYKAAYHLALTKSASYARYTNRSIDGLSLSYGDMAKKYADLAAALKAQYEEEVLSSLGANGGGLYVGGLNVAEKQTDRLNTGLVQPRFRTGQFENEG
jgi:hypothetical protein